MKASRSSSLLEKRFFSLLCVLVRLRGRFQRRVILYCNNPIYARKVGAFASLLRKRGFPVEIVSQAGTRKSRALFKSGLDLWILFGGRVLPPKVALPSIIFYAADPLDRERERNGVDAAYFILMDKSEAVWTYSRTHVQAIVGRGLAVRHVPFGYAPFYEQSYRRHTMGQNSVQDIDVLFFGDLSDRRRTMLERLRQRGMEVRVLDRSNAAYGRELDLLLVRTKIVLVLFHDEEFQTHVPDFARMDHLLANRVFVLHEKTSAYGEEPGFQDNISTSAYDEIPEACAFFLERPEERASRSEKAWLWFTTHYHLDDWIPYEDLARLLDGGMDRHRS